MCQKTKSGRETVPERAALLLHKPPLWHPESACTPRPVCSWDGSWKPKENHFTAGFKNGCPEIHSSFYCSYVSETADGWTKTNANVQIWTTESTVTDVSCKHVNSNLREQEICLKASETVKILLEFLGCIRFSCAVNLQMMFCVSPQNAVEL